MNVILQFTGLGRSMQTCLMKTDMIYQTHRYYSRDNNSFGNKIFDNLRMQAPIPGREAFWDMDTPETKRLVKFLSP